MRTGHAIVRLPTGAEYEGTALYDGHAVSLQFLGGKNFSPQRSQTVQVSVGGTSIGSFSNAGRFVGTAVQPFVIRITPTTVTTDAGVTLVTTGLAAGVKIVATITALQGQAAYDCAYIEANPAPAVILSDIPSYALYPNASWPYTPTDTDVNALNAANLAVAEYFPDGRVITDDGDALINKAGQWLNYVHPARGRAGGSLSRCEPG